MNRTIEEVFYMRVASVKKINPEDYILSVLSPEERFDAAFKVAREAFKGTKLTMKDIENAVETVRRKAYEKKK
jgi:hypothetical protein